MSGDEVLGLVICLLVLGVVMVAASSLRRNAKAARRVEVRRGGAAPRQREGPSRSAAERARHEAQRQVHSQRDVTVGATDDPALGVPAELTESMFPGTDWALVEDVLVEDLNRAFVNRGIDFLDQGNNDGAIEVLTGPARAGYSPAKFCLAIAYMKSGAIDSAIDWYSKAAEDGNVDAMAYLGYVHKLKGDKARAREWLTKAAASGNANAATLIKTLDFDKTSPAAPIIATTGKTMGDLHASAGQFELAVQNWEMAAGAGDSDAMVKIGQVKLRQGIRGEAILWLTRAADAGHSDARVMLASLRRA